MPWFTNIASAADRLALSRAAVATRKVQFWSPAARELAAVALLADETFTKAVPICRSKVEFEKSLLSRVKSGHL